MSRAMDHLNRLCTCDHRYGDHSFSGCQSDEEGQSGMHMGKCGCDEFVAAPDPT